MSTDYDVSRAFKRIENELIDSMIRNLKRHRAEELAEGFNWEQWQVIQLRELERYRAMNLDKFTGDFNDINKRIEDAFKSIYQDASTKEEAKILELIKQGKFTPDTTPISYQFFGVNEAKLNHLIEATKTDFTRGEQAILRTANDQYRKIIFDSQMYASTGATYEQAVDMATKDFLKAGIQSITYKNGAKHTMSDYSRMAIRTGNKRAYLMGEGDVHDKYGIHTVRVNKRSGACPLCVKWLGRVLVDDVYAGGTAKEAEDSHVPLLSQAMAQGFLHPNCKDIYSMYIDGISKPAQPWTKQEIQEIADTYNDEQAVDRAESMVDSYRRMAKNSLDPINKQRYTARADEWQARVDKLNGVEAFDKQAFIDKTYSQFLPNSAGVISTMPLKSATGTAKTITKQLVEPPKVYTATANGKTVSMKPLAKQVTVATQPFEKKLNPSLVDYQEHIKALTKAKADDATLKPILEQAIKQADKELADLKANGATKQKIGGISTKKAFIQKKIDAIDIKAEIQTLEADVQKAQQEKLMLMPQDETFSGIWKQDVKLSEFDIYEPKIKAKKDYFGDEILKWTTNGLSWGKTQAEIDAKIQVLQKQLADVVEYEKKGAVYKQQSDALDIKVKAAEDAVAQKKDDLFKLEHPKQWAKQHANPTGTIDQARRDAAFWAKSQQEADDKLRDKSGEVWRNATNLEKDAIYDYTMSYSKFNEPLRGIEYGTNKKLGVGNTDLNAGWQYNGQQLNAMTDIIEKSSYDEDIWFQRGVGYDGMDSFFGVPMDLLRHGTEAELQQALLDKIVTEYGFMSMGSAKGYGFSNPIIMNIFTPKGTKMMYVEPFSHYGAELHESYTRRKLFGRKWDGKEKQKSFGTELETVLQQNTQFRIKKVEKSYGTIFVDLDVIGQSTPQRYVP